MSEITITAAEINKLRQMTGAGMMDCRKALTENNGDIEAAIDWLRKKGQKVAALRGDRDAKEGVVLAKTTADNKTGITLCLSCETDFVSKNDDFIAFAQSIMDAAIANNVNSAEELNAQEINGAKIADLVNDKLASIGEKIGVSKFERILKCQRMHAQVFLLCQRTIGRCRHRWDKRIYTGIGHEGLNNYSTVGPAGFQACAHIGLAGLQAYAGLASCPCC
jgi:translation elongation factor Ts